jgi:hypothetical protein
LSGLIAYILKPRKPTLKFDRLTKKLGMLMPN